MSTMAASIIHDPLLFYPYGRTSYEAEQYYANLDSTSSPSSAASSSFSSISSNTTTTSSSSFTQRVHEEADWNDIMSNIKKTMYNTTSAVVPSPATYLCKNIPFRPEPSKDPMFFYNTDIVDVKDMYSYRQLRSESLLYRMFNCPLMKIDVDPTSVMRLTKGVFVANKLQRTVPSSPVISPMSLLEDTAYLLDAVPVDGIDTFHYGNMKQFMLQQQQKQQQIAANDFLPFSYTFGARYTNPYHGRDVVIRGGRLPLWCQTLFLNECISRMPLEPNVPYAGLFPFAPSLVIVFQSLATVVNNNLNHEDFYPDLTIAYERYAMELSEPSHLMDLGGTSALWSDQKQQIMNQMLFCDIPQTTVDILTQLATLWAADQGFLF